MLLSIGMPTFEDFDGVYFSLQSLRLHHDVDDCELLVIDNSPTNSTSTTEANKRVCEAAKAKYIQTHPDESSPPSG